MEMAVGLTFDLACDRAMLCGSQNFTTNFWQILPNRGLAEGSDAHPGDYVLEKAFVG